MSRRVSRFNAWLLVVALVFTACVRRFATPTEPLDEAATAVASGATAPRTLALGGFHALLIGGDAAQAKTLFDTALTREPHEPWALLGQMFLGFRQAHPEQQLLAALELCEFNPRHPLCVVAARTVVELAGIATSLDDVVLARAPRLLEAGVSGDAAYLLRVAMQSVAFNRRELEKNQHLLNDMGVTTVGSWVGPLSAWHVLSMGEVTEFEKSGSLEKVGSGPLGPLVIHDAHFADGKFSLDGERQEADVYVFAVDAEVKQAGDYVVRTVTQMDHVVTLDGSRVFERLTWQRPASTLSEKVVSLKAGSHRLMVRLARERLAGQLTVALTRLDGTPADVVFTAAKGMAPQWAGGLDPDDADLLMPTAAALHERLSPKVGVALAAIVAAYDARGRDTDGARRQLMLVPDSMHAPFVSVLRADIDLKDKVLPPKVARGRATRDLEAALSVDPKFTRATVQTAMLLGEDGRHLDALEQVKAARASGGFVSPHLIQLQAQVELSLGLDAQAAVTSRETLKALPGDCEALVMQFDLANKRDAAVETDTALAALTSCPDQRAREFAHFLKRHQLDTAARVGQEILALDANRVSAAITLSQVWVSQKKYDDAVTVLSRLRQQWPRNVTVLKALADVFALMGKTEDALKTREAALLLDGGDLSLRRLVERAKTGKELLEAHAISTEEALKAYQAAPGNEEVGAAYLLDAAAIEVFADGSQVERIHIMQKAIDQGGVDEVGEVSIPQGAVVLKLRTIKPDGSTLEPEGIDNKDTVSMPGVQVGDVVEYEYLQAHSSRGPSQPGFTLSNFYFQVARQPNNWSTYTVIAPLGSGLKVDAHNMDSRPPRVEGDREVYTHTEKRVAPFIPEPLSSPSGNEWLPFVSVGAGQTGNEGVIQAYADAYSEMGVITAEVEAFAQRAADGATGSEAIRRVYVAVMKKLSGRDAGLILSAAGSVSQDRGSRLWLLKAALASLGFDVRMVAVRAFSADPAPYLFPHEGLLPYLCLRVSLPENQFVWLDPMTRFAPFGELPEFALGEREAFIFPEPGKPLQKVKTPARLERPAKTVKLKMALAEDGVLTGEGVEEYVGFEAAQLAEALEAISPEQRTQALQGALSRYFGGADMAGLEVKAPREVGASVTVTYSFKAPRFGRREGPDRMVLTPFTFPALLGRRFLMLSNRTTPLFIEASEKASTSATVTLPNGWSLIDPLADLKLGHQAGKYLRAEAQNGNTLTILEDISVLQSRVPVDLYQSFGQFAGEVDLVQGRDVLLQKK